MDKKEVVEFGEKYLMKEDENRVEDKPKAWIDDGKFLMVKTDKTEIINIFNNYQELEIEKYDKTCEKIRENITAKSVFDVKYIKDVLKLLTKIKTDGKNIIIESGNNSPIIFKLTDKNGQEVVEIALAPIVVEDDR